MLCREVSGGARKGVEKSGGARPDFEERALDVNTKGTRSRPGAGGREEKPGAAGSPQRKVQSEEDAREIGRGATLGASFDRSQILCRARG